MELELHSVELIESNCVGDCIFRNTLISGAAKVIFFVHQKDPFKSADVELIINFNKGYEVSGYDIERIDFNENQGNEIDVREFIIRNIHLCDLTDIIYNKLN